MSWSVASLLVLAAPATAHETQVAGPLRATIGWAEEPALVGAMNAVEIGFARADGTPAPAAGASLKVAISTGDDSTVLSLTPGDEPGVFGAPVVPTRPGVYRFHVTGTVDSQQVDIASTCSEQTFDCVIPATDVQFPAQQPTTNQVAERIVHESARVDRLVDDVALLRLLVLAQLAVIAAAAAAALSVRRRGRRGAG